MLLILRVVVLMLVLMILLSTLRLVVLMVIVDVVYVGYADGGIDVEVGYAGCVVVGVAVYDAVVIVAIGVGCSYGNYGAAIRGVDGVGICAAGVLDAAVDGGDVGVVVCVAVVVVVDVVVVVSGVGVFVAGVVGVYVVDNAVHDGGVDIDGWVDVCVRSRLH